LVKLFVDKEVVLVAVSQILALFLKLFDVDSALLDLLIEVLDGLLQLSEVIDWAFSRRWSLARSTSRGKAPAPAPLG
jgi:hypothetical protein